MPSPSMLRTYSMQLFLLKNDTNGSILIYIHSQKWENALAEHIAYSRHYTRVGDDSSDDLDDIVPLGSMNESLQVGYKEWTNYSVWNL